MWMANRERTERLEEPAAELGEMTFSGETAGVALAGERRGPAICAPGGSHWTPGNGDTVLVIKSGMEAEPCIAGRMQNETEAPAPGEVLLSTAAGTGIRLRADGSMECTGNLRVTGTLIVEGTVRMGETVEMTGDVTANGYALGQPEGEG